MHGYQIRRATKLDRTELWTEVKPGSLYGALHRMAGEGLVEVVRTEREGNPPERTVYAITTAGRQEWPAQRNATRRCARYGYAPTRSIWRCSTPSTWPKKSSPRRSPHAAKPWPRSWRCWNRSYRRRAHTWSGSNR